MNEEERRSNELHRSVTQVSPMQATNSSIPVVGELQSVGDVNQSHTSLPRSPSGGPQAAVTMNSIGLDATQPPLISIPDPTPLQSLPVHSLSEEVNDPVVEQPAVTQSEFQPLPPSDPIDLEVISVTLEQQLRDREREVRSLTARNESLERLLQASGQTGTSKVKQLTEELTRRNSKIKDLEATITNINNQSRQKTTIEKRKSMDKNTLAVRNLEKKVAALERENEELRRVHHSPQQSQQGNSQQVQQFVNSPSSSQDKLLLCNARDCINEFKMQMVRKDQEIEHLRRKLFDAQSAIMTNVDGIAELDSKLQHSRKAVRWLLRSGSPGAAVSRSVSPQQQALPPSYGNRSMSPSHVSPSTELPQYSVGNRSSSYNPYQAQSPQLPPPQTILRQHDLLNRSHLASEQVSALHELENMLVQRESQQQMMQSVPKYR